MAKTDFEEWIAKVGQWQQATNKIPALVHQDIAKSKMKFDEPEEGFKSLLVDPLAVQYALGYKDRKHSLTYDVLKRIPHQLGIVAAILQTRCNQVSAFSVPFRSSKSVGFQIKHKDPGHETSKSEKEMIQSLEKFIYNCGAPDANPHNKMKRDDFETFLKKITRDSLTYDQACAVAGTWVELADGTGLPIESIEAGMKLRTHTCEVQEVLHPTQRLYTGDMVRLQVRGQVLNVTGGHPVYVAARTSHPGNAITLGEPQWVAARDITPEMYVVYPRLSEAGSHTSIPIFHQLPRKYPVGPLSTLLDETGVHPKTVHQILTGIYRKNGPAKQLVLKRAQELGVSYEYKRIVEPLTLLDSDWGFFLGLYAAEGNLRPNGVALTFSGQEEHLVQKVVLHGKKYGISATRVDYQDRNAITVILNSKALATTLKSLCGTGSAKKRVPEFLFTSPPCVRKAFLSGYLQGDGYISTNKTSFTTISRNLFTGVRALLSTFGIVCAEVTSDDCYEHHKVSYVGNLSGPEYRKFATDVGFPVSAAAQCKRTSVVTDTHMFVKATSVEITQGTNVPVYNMEVSTDHSYIAQGFLNHNCIEIVPDRLGQPYEFMAVDAATIRLAATDNVFGPDDSYIYRPPVMSNRLLAQPDERTPFKSMQLMTQTRNGERPDFVQVINGQIENVYYRDEMSFGIRNPRTDIYIQGYGYGEMEQLITILTAHLYAEEYNRRFFMQGCVAGDTPVHTDAGIVPIQSLVGQGFKAWNGHEFVPADVVSSGFKKCVNTTLSNDFALTTSPDHQFLSMSDTGESVMLPISELGKGAYVAVSCKEEPVHTPEPVEIEYSGNYQQPNAIIGTVDSAFWEFVGWVVGDGYVSIHKRGKTKNGADKFSYKTSCVFGAQDADAKTQFQTLLGSLGVKYQMSKGGGSWGGKPLDVLSVSNKGLYTTLVDKLGVSTNKSTTKTVPTKIWSETTAHKKAFLRGLFSADGSASNRRTRFYSSSSQLIEDVQQLLWSLGISSHIDSSVMNESGNPCYQLRVKDAYKYRDEIGFILDYKNDVEFKEAYRHRFEDGTVPHALQRAIALEALQAVPFLEFTKTVGVPVSIVKRSIEGKTKLGRAVLKQLLPFVADKELHRSLEYRWETIVSTDPSDIEIPMYDVRQTHELHQWSCGGCITKNSAPKGILNFKGENFTPDMLEGFKRQWRSNLEGVENSWKTPILQAEQGVEWIDLHPSNREMEYGQWLEYLIKITSAVFLIDPSELNFDLSGGVQQTPLFESSNEWKLKASRDKGLKPLLRFIAKQINDNIIAQIDDHFVFDFVGLDELSEQEKHELRQEQVGSYMTLNEIRRAEDLPDVEDGDTILNPTYIQARQARVQQEQEQAQQDQAAGAGAEGMSAPDQQASAADQGQQENTAPEYAGTFRKSQEGVIEIDLDVYKDLYRGK